MRVIEVITKKTLQGEKVMYLLQAGSSPSSTIMLDQVEGEIFDSADKARSTLIRKASQQINKIVDAAVVKSKEWYGDSQEVVSEMPQSIEDLPDLSSLEQRHDDAPSVMLPDGTLAKIKLPANI